MKKVLFPIATALCVLLAVFPLTAVCGAAVDFTKDGAADQASVYVAGHPDCFPVESYDAESDTYVGAAPAFLSLASETTGFSFVYIRAGEQDRRASLARNNQVDLFFATAEESDLLAVGVEKTKLFSVTKNGAPTDVYCVFTAVSGEKERAAIRAVALALTKDDIAQLLTADTSPSISRRQFRLMLIVLGGALLCAAVALILSLVLIVKRRRKKDAFVDHATAIGNKNYFMQKFDSAITDQTREIYYIVHFAFAIGKVNNSHGNDESDRILQYTAETITKRMRDNEFCARIGGGSFAAAISSNGDDQVEKRVGEILRVLNVYGEKNKKSELNSLFCAGICALSADDKSAEIALYNAEQAYLRAVKEKRAYVFVSHDALNEHKTKASIREQAGDALEQRAFTPYVQFIVNASDGSICGGELLSRWENRVYGLLNPGSYIPILQDMGLILRHDLFMLEEACRLLEQWQVDGKTYFLTCNLTRVTISDPALVDKVMAITEQYAFAREKLVLEVTEDSIEEDKKSALQNMVNLKEKGFRIALDDFSRGYSTVTNLYEYAVDLVKIDRQMIQDADHDPQAAALMKEIAKLCHGLNIRVLAEGVENEQEARLAHSALCDYIQGYFYARALPLRELSGFEKTYQEKAVAFDGETDGACDVASNEAAATDPPEPSGGELPAVPAAHPILTPAAVFPNGSSAAVPPAAEQRPAPAPLPETQSTGEKAAQQETQTVSDADAPAPVPASAQPSQPGSAADKPMLCIQYGPYRLDLPGSIDIQPVSEILRAIQEKMEDVR